MINKSKIEQAKKDFHYQKKFLRIYSEHNQVFINEFYLGNYRVGYTLVQISNTVDFYRAFKDLGNILDWVEDRLELNKGDSTFTIKTQTETGKMFYSKEDKTFCIHMKVKPHIYKNKTHHFKTKSIEKMLDWIIKTSYS